MNAVSNGEAEGLRQAVSELWQAKNAAQPAQASLLDRASKSMAKCRSKGKGWKRIRKLKDGAQRRLYASGARILWKDVLGPGGRGGRSAPPSRDPGRAGADRYLQDL